MLKPDGIGEKLRDFLMEGAPMKEKNLSLVKSNSESESIENQTADLNDKSSQFIPILDFIKKKRTQLKINSGPRSKRGLGLRKYQDSIDLENKIHSLLYPVNIDTQS